MSRRSGQRFCLWMICPILTIVLESSVQRQTLLRTQTEQQQLPYELWLHIFSYVEDRNDIVNLCRCSGTLREIAEVYLYRNLNINFSAVNGGARRALMLLEAIRNPRFSSVTTEIRVNFQSCRQRIDTARGETSPKKCKCGAIDDMFGVALQSMRVLEVLSIECHFCMNLSTGRHHYLTNLATKNLRQLRYECHCSMGNSFDPAALLSAPWMRSVTALNWPPSLWTSIPPITLRGLMKTDGFLPNIDTLNYAGPGLYDELLTKRTIRRLSSLVIDPSPPLDNHPNRRLITHLSINEYCLNTLLTGVMGIGQFGNLQHLGTLPFSQDFSNTNNDVVSLGSACYPGIVLSSSVVPNYRQCLGAHLRPQEIGLHRYMYETL